MSNETNDLAGEPLVTLDPATQADWPLIRSWLARPDIQDWWGPLAASEAAVMLAMNSEHAICRLIRADGQPVGYAHAVDATLWGETLPDDLPAGTWDIDLFVAAEDHRNLGVGQRALILLRDEVFTTTFAVAISIFASIANERAVRAYEKAGFRWRRVVTDPVHGPEWFMLAERPRS